MKRANSRKAKSTSPTSGTRSSAGLSCSQAGGDHLQSQFVIPFYRVAELRMAEDQCLNRLFSDHRRRRRPVVQHPNLAEELSGSKSNRLLRLAGDLGVAGNNDEEGSGGLTLP